MSIPIHPFSYIQKAYRVLDASLKVLERDRIEERSQTGQPLDGDELEAVIQLLEPFKHRIQDFYLNMGETGGYE